MSALTVIIPSKDRLDLLQQVTAGLYRYTDMAITVLVVDAGTDDTFTWCRANNINCLAKPGATFAQAINAAISQGHCARSVLLLNNDIVLHDDLVSELWRAYTNAESQAIVGARLVYPNGLIQHGGIGFDMAGNPYHLWHQAPAEHPEAMKRRALPAVTYACALMPRVLLETFPLDENYHNAYEDVDHCLKAREAGLPVFYAPTARATHLTGQTPGRNDRVAESWQRFHDVWLKDGRLWQALGVWPFERRAS